MHGGDTIPQYGPWLRVSLSNRWTDRGRGSADSDQRSQEEYTRSWWASGDNQRRDNGSNSQRDSGDSSHNSGDLIYRAAKSIIPDNAEGSLPHVVGDIGSVAANKEGGVCGKGKEVMVEVDSAIGFTKVIETAGNMQEMLRGHVQDSSPANVNPNQCPDVNKVGLECTSPLHLSRGKDPGIADIVAILKNGLQVQAGDTQKLKSTFKRRRAKGEFKEEQGVKLKSCPLGRRKAEVHVVDGGEEGNSNSKKGKWVVVEDHAGTDKLAEAGLQPRQLQ